MSKFYVYEHWRQDTGTCFYVGKGHGQRKNTIKRPKNKRHSNIVSKLERDGFGVDVIIIAQGLSEYGAFDLEIERITYWRSVGDELCNLTNGGEGASGYRQTDEHRAKIGASKKGFPRSAETIAKLKSSFAGKPFPKEALQKAIIARTGKPHSEETRAKIGASHRGRKHTKETCDNMSAWQIGRTLSSEHRASISAALRRPEVIAKISAASTGRPCSPETRAKISASRKRYNADKAAALADPA